MITVPTLTGQQFAMIRDLTDKQARNEQGLFLAEGDRAVCQILANGRIEVTMLVVERKRTEEGSLPPLVTEKTAELPLYAVSSRKARQLADTKNSQGLMAVCRMPEPVHAVTLLKNQGIILALDGLQDPGNMGTIIRTAVWFGLAGMVMCPETVDLFHPKVIRSMAGSVGVMPWLRADLPDFLNQAASAGWHVHLLDPASGSVDYRTCKASGRDILVTGNEARGIRDDLKSLFGSRIHIEPVDPIVHPAADADMNMDTERGTAPDRGRRSGSDKKDPDRFEASGEKKGVSGVESLNASVAAAIVMAHFAVSCRSGYDQKG